jgi:hypothetical protein
MKKSKKIIYVSGMISAVLVPVIFLFFAIPAYKQINVSVLDLGLPARESANYKIPEEYKFPSPEKGWKYQTIKLPINFSENDEQKYYNLVKELQDKKYDKIGIRFQFNNENTYNDFVKLINLMLKTKQESYGFRSEDNSFYVVKFKQIEEFKSWCGTNSSMNYIDGDEWNERNKLGNFGYFLSKLPKESFYIIFGYLILIYSAMLKPKMTFNI